MWTSLVSRSNRSLQRARVEYVTELVTNNLIILRLRYCYIALILIVDIFFGDEFLPDG